MKLQLASMLWVVVLWAVSGAAIAAGKINQREAQAVTDAPAAPSILPPNLFPNVSPLFGPALAPNVSPTVTAPVVAPFLSPASPIRPAVSPFLSPNSGPVITPALAPNRPVISPFAPAVAPALTPLVKPSIVSTLFPALGPVFNDSCAAISSFFSEDVQCNCSRGSFLGGQFDFTCEYKDVTCTQNGTICGRLSYQTSLDLANSSFTSTVCIHNMTRPSQQQYDDLCVTADIAIDNGNVTNSTAPIYSCHVTYGNQTCRGCMPCQEGYTGVVLDCSNINADLTTQACTQLDLNFNFSNPGILDGFWPNFNGSCSYLEGLSDGVIVCECDGAGSPNLTVSCRTVNETCSLFDPSRCAEVNSSVSFLDSQLHSITSCTDVETDASGPVEVCSTFTLCTDSMLEICSSNMTLNGEPCETQVCSGGRSVSFNCSATDPNFVTRGCQNITLRSALAFLPDFRQANYSGTFAPEGSPVVSPILSPAVSPLAAPTLPVLSPLVQPVVGPVVPTIPDRLPSQSPQTTPVAPANAPVKSPTSPSGAQGTSGASRNHQWVAHIFITGWVGLACFAVAGLTW